MTDTYIGIQTQKMSPVEPADWRPNTAAMHLHNICKE